MEEQKRRHVIDFLIILAMMATVIVLCHPFGRNWTEEEAERYIGTDGEYSPDVDSFYYFRKAKEFSEGGIGSIKLVSYREEDKLCTSGETIAREANGAMPQLLPATAALTWYGLRAIGVDIGIYTVTIRFCSFLLSLFVIPIYLFLRRRTSRIAAMLGSLLAALEVPFFRHSHVGYFDTDAMIGLLALLLILSLFECFSRKNRKEQIVYGAIAFVALVLLRFTWTAFFIYGVISAGTALVGVVGVRLCGKFNEKQKKALVVPGVFWLSVIFSSLVLGWNSFISLAKGFISSPTGVGDWPSETLNISELQRVPLSDAQSLWYHWIGVGSDVTSVTGGVLALSLLLISAGICVVQLIRFIRCRSGETEKVFLLSAVLIWMCGSTVLAFFGLRYMEFFALPAAIVSGLGFNSIETYCRSKSINARRVLYVVVGLMLFGGLVLRFRFVAVVVSSIVWGVGWFFSKRRSGKVLAVLFALAILLPIGISCRVICAQDVPYVESPMEKAMGWVKDNTDSDAVIADFWNLGYIYQYYGERRTIADGGTYNGQFFYWLANMMVTDDFRLSAGIARMLQNCGIDGSEYAQELTGNATDARKLLNSILPLSRLTAETVLMNESKFSQAQIKQLLDYTHPLECPEVFFAISHNTFEIISGLMIYRYWDEGKETRGATYYSTEALLRPKEGETVYGKMTQERGDSNSPIALVAVKSQNDELMGTIVTPEGNSVECERLIYIKNGETVYDRRVNDLVEGIAFAQDEALMIFEEDGLVSAVLLEKNVVDSVFVKMFLLNETPQEIFERVYDSEGEKNGPFVQNRIDDNSAISIWKVHFE